MIAGYVVEAQALPLLEGYIQKLPRVAVNAARIAINDTADKKGMTLLKEEIEAQVNFPKGYLNRQRLGVTKRATNSDLTAEVTARSRATSLARFTNATVAGSRRAGGVSVRVDPGRSTAIPGAFLVRLRSGADDLGNIGLAIRLAPGETLKGRNLGIGARLAPNVPLLYGPSVDQVFRDVAADEADAVGGLVATEFFRQFSRLASE